jgi:hypothetical protein
VIALQPEQPGLQRGRTIFVADAHQAADTRRYDY